MNSNNVLNRFFSKTMLLNIVENSYHSCYGEIISRYSLDENGTNGEIISSIYKVLSKNYRNEYFYKNTLLNSLIVKKHKLYTTKVLIELPISRSIADFITLNGKAVVYEIKTELDNLDRIENQIKDYYKCFPYVCVVTCQTHLDKIIEKFKNTSIGIYYFTDRNRIKVMQEPEADYSMLEHEAMFKLLRKYEFEQIIKKKYKNLPETTQFCYYSKCFSMFKEIDKETLYKEMLALLKNRCVIEVEKFKGVPDELKMLVYQSRFNDEQYSKLSEFLCKEYKKGDSLDVFSVFEG